MRRFLVPSFIVLILLLAAVAVAYPRWGYSWHARVTSASELFSTEAGPTSAYLVHGKKENPIGALAVGDNVAVLWDTYGKDYWACYVRGPRGERGWLLCTDLRRTRGAIGT
jgi:hypothetical protein